LKRYFRFAWQHPYLLAALSVVLFLPWLWMSFLVPPWAIALSLALVPLAAFVALALVVRDVQVEEDEAAAAAGDDEALLKFRKRTRLFQQVVVGLDTMLERWDSASQTNRRNLESAADSVQEVIRLTEDAVNELTNGFRVVVAKANEQTEAAKTLLTGEGGSGMLSHDEFIKAYDTQLQNVTSHMTNFGIAAEDLASHQERVQEHARVMEGTIDGLRNMASQIARIALDGSVKMTSGSLKPQDFVEMTDRIRAISGEAHELTRKTRAGLDAIGDQVRQGNKRTIQVADAARRAVGVARAEINTLNAATIEQARQVEIALQRINALSVEIQADINNIIIAMQFQDITRQKLERLHKPVLGAAAESLSLLSHETRALLQRDLYRAVRAYAESAIKPRASGEASHDAAPGLDALASVREAPPHDPAPPEKKVEIF
jgi:methyl-accepting chemotaxis protein